MHTMQSRLLTLNSSPWLHQDHPHFMIFVKMSFHSIWPRALLLTLVIQFAKHIKYPKSIGCYCNIFPFSFSHANGLSDILLGYYKDDLTKINIKLWFMSTFLIHFQNLYLLSINNFFYTESLHKLPYSFTTLTIVMINFQIVRFAETNQQS